MKFALFPAIAAASSTIAMYALSADGTVSGYLTSKHGGAGFNYFLVDQVGEPLFQNDNGLILADICEPGQPWPVGYMSNFLVAGPAVEPGIFTFNSAHALETDRMFWGCKNIGDPYNYSADSFMILFGSRPGDDCYEVQITSVVPNDD